MEEPKRIDSITPADYNPRTMTEQKAAALKRSIDELGDISGIVKNIHTGNQVTGHQRIAIMKGEGNAEIQYTWRATEAPGVGGTTALGYIIHPTTSERFAYREVNWPIEKEKVANIAANHKNLQGDWDEAALARIDYDLSLLDNGAELLAMTGQDQKQIDKMLASAGVNPLGEEQPDEIGAGPKDSDKLEFRMTREQREVVEEAIGNIVATREMAAEENGTKNGSALYYMARDHLDRVHGETETPPASPDLTVA